MLSKQPIRFRIDEKYRPQRCNAVENLLTNFDDSGKTFVRTAKSSKIVEMIGKYRVIVVQT